MKKTISSEKSSVKPFLKTPLFVGLIVTFIVLLLMYLLPNSADYIVIIAYVLALVYILIIQDRKLLYTMLLAFLFAVMWLFVGKAEYGYNRNYIILFGINIFPLFLWAIGLFAIYLIYEYFTRYFSERFIVRLLLFSIIFWICLISIESLAYHVLIVRNAMTGNYPGLPLCDCIHAPRWMQAVYLSMGPIFFIANYLIRKCVFQNKNK